VDVRLAQAQPGAGTALSQGRHPGAPAENRKLSGTALPLLALRTGLWLSYDFLGLGMACNAVALAGLAGCWGTGLYLLLTATSATGLLTAGLLLAAGWAWLGAAAAGICALWKNCLENREGSFRDFWTGLARFGPAGAGGGLALGLAVTGPLVAAQLYAGGHMALPFPVAVALAGVALTAALAAFAVGLWYWPATVYVAEAWRYRLRIAAALAATRPGLTVAVLGLAAAMIVPVAVFVVPVVIVWSLAQALALVMAAYAWLIREQEAGPGPFPAPDDPLWSEYASRTIRDFLFPWKE